ncbi:putative S-adenosyl-L-methionine-dependent methyltransferase [Rosa chinensis]|uniref:Putative S-adenosyl-L-methionine-dependent methyltransferase n=2 Tax=Rosa chinensis TaxID=74649 RepID=A0A2P6SCZ2_ROSCH|nr:putative S-adenosyl-L-methionine-dependent methyltransferase [Rosa chinensis]
MGEQLLNGDKALCVSEGSASAVMALQDLGFPNARGVYEHRFFSLKRKQFGYEIYYEDKSFDFVFCRDLDKVSVPALLVLEIERVLSPGGIGAMLVGSSGLAPNSLIRSATPISSLLKSSSVVHVNYISNFTLVVFRKSYENAGLFEQYRLPADCQSLTNNRPLIEKMEPLVKEKPVEDGKMATYLPNFIDVSSKKRLVYIDIGAAEHLKSNVTDWFLPSYPITHRAFHVYFVDHNTSVLLSYVKKPGITFVYHPGLAGIKDKDNVNIEADAEPYVADEGFDFLVWFKETVQHAEFVVLKMNAGSVELKFLIHTRPLPIP